MRKQKSATGTADAHLTTELARRSPSRHPTTSMGVWEVTGKQKKDHSQVVEERRLDYELLERWIKYMGKPTDKYHDKEAWQALDEEGRRY